MKECQNKTDEQLVLLSLSNENYFSCLVERYEKSLTRYIFRISSVTREDAEDLLQDIFIKAYINLNDFDPRLKFSSWIYRIAHNEVVSFWRKNKARPQLVSIDDSEFNLIENLASDLDLLDEMEKLENKKNIKKILLSLKTEYREILVLKYLEEKSYEEISDILKKPLGTIASLISRAKAEFRKRLAENRNRYGEQKPEIGNQ